MAKSRRTRLGGSWRAGGVIGGVFGVYYDTYRRARPDRSDTHLPFAKDTFCPAHLVGEETDQALPAGRGEYGRNLDGRKDGSKAGRRTGGISGPARCSAGIGVRI